MTGGVETELIPEKQVRDGSENESFRKIKRRREKDRKTMAENITNQDECADVVEQ